MTAFRIVLAGLALACLCLPAFAHPHVWVTARSEIVYGPDGRMSAVRHAWTFDDMFSSFASQGLDVDGDGKLTREELAPLAETNVTSLKEFGFFTFSKNGQSKVSFNEPVDYWLEQTDDKRLVLHFTLPVKDNAPAKGAALKVEVYDPTYFVAFEFAKDDPAKLVSAPDGCALDVARPKEPDAAASQKLSESFFTGLSPGDNFGAQFSNAISVSCR
ncbi:DUF1007 family protein [Methylopila henanensis]|uniref:DUF1007 family protein n=1 Tax=Methylopila henanensis TaxID=873516 RepID=A0ABW4K6C5_9HYPH